MGTKLKTKFVSLSPDSGAVDIDLFIAECQTIQRDWTRAFESHHGNVALLDVPPVADELASVIEAVKGWRDNNNASVVQGHGDGREITPYWRPIEKDLACAQSEDK